MIGCSDYFSFSTVNYKLLQLTISSCFAFYLWKEQWSYDQYAGLLIKWSVVKFVAGFVWGMENLEISKI